MVQKEIRQNPVGTLQPKPGAEEPSSGWKTLCVRGISRMVMERLPAVRNSIKLNEASTK
jgi:hypothetical protein